MNEKKCFVFIVCLLFFCFTGCRTTSGVYDNRAGAGAVREGFEKLGDEQTRSAVTGAELAGEIKGSVEEVERIERTIKDGAGGIEEFKDILRRIREKNGRKNSAETDAN